MAICPACGTEFHCGPVAGEAACWCQKLPALPMPTGDVGCWCPACLHECIAARDSSAESDPARK